MTPSLECRNVSKQYGNTREGEMAVRGVSLALNRGQTCVLLGPSGSGKTTLLSMLGCLMAPTGGDVVLDGERVAFDRPQRLQALRRQSIGFVFQQSHLLPFLSIEQNLQLVARNAGLGREQIAARVRHVAEALEISPYLRRKPDEVSGGQRQRGAIARALIHRPAVLLADEPTAALDWERGQSAMRLLISQAKSENALLIVVTHDWRLVPFFDRVLKMESGQVSEP